MSTPRLCVSLACLAMLLAAPLQAQIEYTDSRFSDMEDYKNHPCNRQCEHMAPPRLCKYEWVAESYWTMSKACGNCPFNQSDCFKPHCVSADGVSRGLSVINRKLPGPALEVCQRDIVEVKVRNDLQNAEGTSIHWHGLLQRGSPHMDGVTMLTQCPITSHSSFTYRFEAQDAGTHYWHGHAGMQRADGIFGAIVVRQTQQREPHHALYDYDLSEHVMIVNDWLVDMTLTRFAAHHHDDGDNKPELMLINGLGAHQEFEKDNTTFTTPRATFTVEGGKRYRFRVISGAILNCPIQISVDGHTMTVIASDGSPFEPFVVDSFNIFAGERFDFVLFADKTDVLRNYWIRARGLADCSVKKANQVAMLKYAGAPDVPPPEPTDYEAGIRDGLTLNPWNTPGSDTQVEVSRMRAVEPDGDGNPDGILTKVPDKKFYLGMDFNKVDNFKFNNPEYYPLTAVVRKQHLYSPQINRITSALPSSPPLSQYDDVDASMYCNEFTMQKHCDQEWCHCIHKLDVALGDLVELVVVDEGVTFNANHPMHLHGFKFRTVGIGKVGTSTSIPEIKAMDARGELTRSTLRAPLKDTVTVPDGGYTIMRFWADNPGMWFFHCHVEYHVDIGMSIIFQVGGKSEFPKPPKNFPRCGSWRPSEDDEDDDDGDGDGHNNNHMAMNMSMYQRPIVVQCVGSANTSPKTAVAQILLIVVMATWASTFNLCSAF